jgi:CRP-like cAMP-binding protein
MKMENSFIRHIIDKSIYIDNIETFREITSSEPDNFDLLAAYADFLLSKNQKELAWRIYGDAAQGFLKTGHQLKSMIMSLAQWQLRKPSKEEVSSYLSLISEIENKQTKFSAFISQLSPAEKFALLCKFKREQCPARHLLKRPGEIETRVFFVVGGNLKESCFELLTAKRVQTAGPSKILAEEDAFGNVYPFSGEQISNSYVETLTHVQTAVVSKDDLRMLCSVYPNIENAIIKLCEIRKRNSGPKGMALRKSVRYPINVEMKVHVKSNAPLTGIRSFTGYSKDISISGVGFVAYDCTRASRDEVCQILEQNLRIDVDIEVYSHGLSLWTPGAIVRLQESIENGKKTVIFGIEYTELPPNLLGHLFSFTKLISNLRIHSNLSN